MNNKRIKKKTICVDMTEEELEELEEVKKKFSSSTNSNTIRAAIKRALVGSYNEL